MPGAQEKEKKKRKSKPERKKLVLLSKEEAENRLSVIFSLSRSPSLVAAPPRPFRAFFSTQKNNAQARAALEAAIRGFPGRGGRSFGNISGRSRSRGFGFGCFGDGGRERNSCRNNLRSPPCPLAPAQAQVHRRRRHRALLPLFRVRKVREEERQTKREREKKNSLIFLFG